MPLLFGSPFVLVLGSLLFSFSILGFLISRIFRRNDVADILWGLGFVFLGAVTVASQESLSLKALMIFTLVLCWGLRLSLYLFLRNRSKPEDPRYAQWRKDWGAREPVRAYLQVFLLQSLIMGVIALPFLMSLTMPEVQILPLDFLGLGLSILGLLIEATADTQLYLFKKNPANKGVLFKEGVWRFTRHPNYLGEILFWWGIFLMSSHLSNFAVYLVSPVLITFLLLKVSGVPMLKKNKDAQDLRPEVFPVNFQVILQFLSLFVILIGLDFLWLGIGMNDFYLKESSSIARMQDGRWVVEFWAAGGVYIALALLLQIFVFKEAKEIAEAVFRAALLGLLIYAVYDLTNVALLTNWSLRMALVDLSWGAILCGTGAGLHWLLWRKLFKVS